MKGVRQKKLSTKIPRTKVASPTRGLGGTSFSSPLPHVDLKKPSLQKQKSYAKDKFLDPMNYTGFGYYVP